MKIYYLGNFLPSSSTETHLSKTLTKLGHEVVQIQENFTDPNHLAERLKMETFDLFLWTRTWDGTLLNEHLDVLRARGIPSVSYHLDLYVGLKRDGGLGTSPFWHTDFVFTPDGNKQAAKVFREKGINHYYIKPGVFEDECDIFNYQPEKDIIFVGSYNYHPEWPYRAKLIDWLRNTYREKFELWGSDGLGPIRGWELNQLYGRTKIVIGDTLSLPGNDHYWSDRVYETLGRGGFLIHPEIKGMKEEFKDAVHLRYYEYGNFKQLKYFIDHYLKNDEEREKIRQAGHKFVKENATYTNRMKQMLETVANVRQKIILESEVN